MNRFWALLGAAGLAFAGLAASASARPVASSGDSCTVSGGGTTYTLDITVHGGPQQYGFAFDAAGSAVANAVIPGTNGSFSTQALAPRTSGAWTSDAPLTGGLAATLTLKAPASGAFTIVPRGESQGSYFDAVACTSAPAPAATPAFSVDPTLGYVVKGALWHLNVSLPTSGTVSATQPEPTMGGASALPVTAKADVYSTRLVAGAGTATLTLHATGAGTKALQAKGSVTFPLRITFDPISGSSSSKLVTVTLTRS